MKTKSVPITVTFRHIAPSDALRSYAEKKLKHVALMPGIVDAHVTLTADAHRRQSAEIVLYGSHSVLKAVEETDDLYAAIDLAVAKIDAQVRKARGRVIQAPRRGSAAVRRSGASAAPA
ncbi:MAG TPA: ribosome-associated translation inhibitor RaiA [Candidatus Binatia bacterium]